MTTCNLCGLSCILGESKDWRGDSYGLIEAEVVGGYYSTPGNGEGALDDLMSYEFSLCEFCLDWLFSQFKVPVSISSYMSPGEPEPPWKPALQRVNEEEWRKDKTGFLKEKLRRDKAREGR